MEIREKDSAHEIRIFELSNVSQRSIHKDGFWQSLM